MKPRPWRLTRRQRVEMEAALLRVRDGVFFSAVYDGAACLGVVDMSEGRARGARILRARVAIALRAALRADEDARCEEALAGAGHGEETGDAPGDAWDIGYDEGAEAVAHRLREWPVISRGWWDRVPLALWERKTSLWAASPPTSGGPRHG